MKTNRATIWFSAIVLFSCWFALAHPGASVGDKAGAKDKIKELQKQRLEAAKEVRDYFFKQLAQGYLPPGATSLSFYVQLIEANKLVFQAQLDLYETKPERIKAIEETIKVVEPVMALLEVQYNKAQVGSAKPAFHMLQVHFLELKIALEKAMQETRGK